MLLQKDFPQIYRYCISLHTFFLGSVLTFVLENCEMLFWTKTFEFPAWTTIKTIVQPSPKRHVTINAQIISFPIVLNK